MATEEDLRAALARLADPQSGADIVGAGRISGLILRGGRAGAVLSIDGLAAHEAKVLEERVTAALSAVEGVNEARVIVTAERGDQPRQPAASDPHPTQPAVLPDIKRIIAVASGKGGVGKSTLATNLAVALARKGLTVGLLDADIYGPSVPMLLGQSGRAQLREGRIQPIDAHGIKAVSMGSMADPGKAVIWRGPMASSAMMQMLTQTDWGPLDLLIIDLPPGTGDIQLTMTQKVPLAGAVIVSTPQDLALLDAKKAMAMFAKVNVPVLGMVENMSSFACPSCGHESHIFGHGGAMHVAETMGIPYLGGVPLVLSIRESGDAGVPSALGNDAAGQAFMNIAGVLLGVLK